MSFNTASGTRGGRVPSGAFFRLVNKVVAGVIRRRGEVGGTSALLLTTVGAKTGKERVNPVSWFPGGDGSWLIVASANGAVSNPGWYHNLKAHPGSARIEVGGRSIAVDAEQLQGAERERAWTLVSGNPRFAGYQTKTDRELPIIRLTAKA